MFTDRKFNTKQSKMNEKMRQYISDLIRWALDEQLSDYDASKDLKLKIEKQFKGSWQIIVGKDIHIYFEEEALSEFLELQTETRTIIIFRRKQTEPLMSSTLEMPPTKLLKQNTIA